MPILSTVLGTAMLGTSDTPGVDDRVLPAMTIRNLVNLGNPTEEASGRAVAYTRGLL